MSSSTLTPSGPPAVSWRPRKEAPRTRATYETDVYTWTQEQAAALRDKHWAALDLEQLAEEVEDVGRNIRFAIEHQLERLLIHVLKLAYDPRRGPDAAGRGASWMPVRRSPGGRRGRDNAIRPSLCPTPTVTSAVAPCC